MSLGKTWAQHGGHASQSGWEMGRAEWRQPQERKLLYAGEAICCLVPMQGAGSIEKPRAKHLIPRACGSNQAACHYLYEISRALDIAMTIASYGYTMCSVQCCPNSPHVSSFEAQELDSKALQLLKHRHASGSGCCQIVLLLLHWVDAHIAILSASGKAPAIRVDGNSIHRPKVASDTANLLHEDLHRHKLEIQQAL